MTQSFNKSAQRLGRVVGAVVIEPPPLRWGLDFYLWAFNDLDRDRHHGESWMRIPWSSMLRYAEHYELGEDQTERFIQTMMIVDDAHIEKLEALRKERDPQKASK